MESRPVNITIITDSYSRVNDRELDSLIVNSSPMELNDTMELDNDDVSQESELCTEEDLIEAVQEFLDNALNGADNNSEEYPQLIQPEEAREEDAGWGERDNGGPVKLSTIGKLSVSNGGIRISYNESELTNASGSKTLIYFDDPDEVTMVRSGSTQTNLAFNGKRERRMCNYNAIMPFEIAVITEKFKNTVTYGQGGVIDVSYYVELRGMCLEKCRMKVTVKPI